MVKNDESITRLNEKYMSDFLKHIKKDFIHKNEYLNMIRI